MDAQHEAFAHFKAMTIRHPVLDQVDTQLMDAIYERAGIALVLLLGPSGVGKSTVIRQIEHRLQAQAAAQAQPTTPVVIVETRPADGPRFNRDDYYRLILQQLGESMIPYTYLLDVNAEPNGSGKKGNARGRVDSPELRSAMEAALKRHSVQAVILDEAQHLLGDGRLQSQWDWLKSMTNATQILHILVGTYELLPMRNISGQASRRSLDVHFSRYLQQNKTDQVAFKNALFTLLHHIPLETDTDALLKQWGYFYSHSIGCIGILKDWLVKATAATLREGGTRLTMERIAQYAHSPAQCERMALEAVQGEREVTATAESTQRLAELLQMKKVPQPDLREAMPPEKVDEPKDKEPAKKGRGQGVGRRKPVRDVIGPGLS